MTDAVASANIISDDASHSGLDIANLFARNTDSYEVLDYITHVVHDKSYEKLMAARLGLGSF